MPKTPKFIIDMKSNPRSPKDGNRKAPAQAHSNPVDGTGTRNDGADAFSYAVAAGAIYGPVMPLPNPPGTGADHLKQMQEMMVQQVQKLMVSIPSWSIDDFRPKPPEIPHAGIRAGEIIGYRLWWVHKDGRLRSLVQDEIIWEPGIPMTGDINKCVHISMRGPDRFGGVYAFSNYNSARIEFTSILVDIQIGRPIEGELIGLVLGTVKLWGEVVEHEDGYRASFAKPKEFLRTYYWSKTPTRDPYDLYFGPRPAIDSSRWTG